MSLAHNYYDLWRVSLKVHLSITLYSPGLLLSRSFRQIRTKRNVEMWCVLCTVLCTDGVQITKWTTISWYLLFVSSEPPTSPFHHEQQQSAYFLRHHHFITFLHQPGCRSSNQHSTRQTLQRCHLITISHMYGVGPFKRHVSAVVISPWLMSFKYFARIRPCQFDR